MSNWSFVGRSTELNRLRTTAEGATGRGLVLAGTAGIGKSRLLRECLGVLPPDRYAVWTASANAATAQLPFGGLAQALPADQPPGLSPAGLLRWTVDALREQAGGRHAVFAVDDAHLLDPVSAALIYLLARSGYATILATLRTGEGVPDQISALWRDDLVDRIELSPLTVAETGDLLAELMGATLDSASVDRLHRLSQGNALLLRELVFAAKGSGEMHEAYGVWRWTGRLDLAPSLAEVVDARIGQLTPETRTVVELVALGEPIGLALLGEACEQTSVEEAEERGLIRVQTDERRTVVRLGHPLYGEVVRARCPVSRTRRLLAQLADLVERCGARRREDLLRVAVWRLDSDTAHDPGLLLAAGRQAFAKYDIPLASRLARAALDAGGGFDAAELLATILMFSDRPIEADEVLSGVGDQLTTEHRHSRWLGARALIRNWGLAEDDAPKHLAADSESLTDPGHRAWVAGFESIMRLHRLEITEAERLSQAVLEKPAATAGARALALSVLAHIQASRGFTARAARTVEEIEADAAEWRADSPYFQLAVELARGTGLIIAADFSGVDAIAAAEFADLADEGDFALGSGYLSVIRGQAARLRGQLAEALRCQRQACAVLSGSRIFAGLAHAERAHAAAVSGDRGLAVEAMTEADRAQAPTTAVLYPWLEHARCWVFASTGDRTAAAEVSRRLAVRLRGDGFHGHEVFALHDLARLGHADEVVDRLDELSVLTEGPIAGVLAQHARAVADADGPALLAAADQLAELDLNLYAAEATATAVGVLRPARSPRVPEATARLAALLTEYPGIRTPAMQVKLPSLTGRELQVAKLAAVGVPSKEIADQLFLSTRTVDNHLLRVYGKLGINGRTELSQALRAIREDT